MINLFLLIISVVHMCDCTVECFASKALIHKVYDILSGQVLRMLYNI